MLPGIMNQLGAENVWSLKNLANTLKNAAEGAKAGAGEVDIDEDDVPQLVENFEETSKSEPDSAAPALEKVVASEDVKIEEVKEEQK